MTDEPTSNAAFDARDVLQAIIEGTPDVVFIKDLQGRYLSFNQAASAIVGQPAGAVIGQNDAALFSPDDARAVMEIDRAIITDGVTRTYEEHLTTSDGRRRTFVSTKGAIFDSHGTITGLFALDGPPSADSPAPQR